MKEHLSSEVSCEWCGRSFRAWNRELRRGKARFCSVACVGSERSSRKNPNWRAEAVQRAKQADPEMYRKKRYANDVIRKLVRRGKLARGRCETCGAPNAEAHHDDYDKPFEIRWLCRSHHMQFDRNKHKALA